MSRFHRSPHERAQSVLADRIGVLAHEFDDVPSRSQAVTAGWLQGGRLERAQPQS